MQRIVVPSSIARFPNGMAGAWLARRWYYMPKSHRAYSVRQIAPGDRRLLAEFAVGLTRTSAEREQPVVQGLISMLFDRVIGGDDQATGFVALENTSAGDRVIGASIYAPMPRDGAECCLAVAGGYRDEQVGRTLLSTLIRHAKRAGIPRLCGEMCWSNRPMQILALSMGFAMVPVARDRNLRRLELALK